MGSLGSKTDYGATSALPLPWKCQQELELQIWSSCHCCCEVSCTPGAALGPFTWCPREYGGSEQGGGTRSPSWHL